MLLLIVFNIDIDNREVWGLAEDLARYHIHALPYAVAGTLDTLAAETYKTSRAGLKEKFVLRNTYTERSLNFRKCTNRTNIDTMSSEIGSTAEYMAKQEAGFKSKRAWIPTAESSAEGKGRRTKPIKTGFYRSRIRVDDKTMSLRASGVRSKRSLLVRAVNIAVDKNKRMLLLGAWAGIRSGMYRLVGGESGGEETAAGWPRGAKLRMIYSRDPAITETKAHEWLGPATLENNAHCAEIFKREIIKQIKMRKLFAARKAAGKR